MDKPNPDNLTAKQRVNKQAFIGAIQHDMAFIGKRYQINLTKLDDTELRELWRYVQDKNSDSQMRINRQRQQPWRRI